MAQRAFWLDTETGRAIELPDIYHMRYVVQNLKTFGFSGQEAEKLRKMSPDRVPYEMSDFPKWLVKPLLARWVKVRVDERHVNFTTQDRVTRRQLEAMQDFMMEKRFRQGVFLMGEPSGRILARFIKPEEFQTVQQPGELRRIAARFRVGQVWRRRDGLSYRLVARAAGGWNVQIGSEPKCWSFTDRHLHNLVCSERLKPASVTGAEVLVRLRAAGLNSLANRLVLALKPVKQKLRRALKSVDEEKVLFDKLDEESDPRYRNRLKDMIENVQDTLREDGPLTRKTNPIGIPNFVNRDSVLEPNLVTRKVETTDDMGR